MSDRNLRLFAFVVAVAAAVASTAAWAADIAVPGASPAAAYYPPYQPALYNWTGVYVGGNGGGGNMQDTYTALAGNGLQTTGTQFHISETNFVAGVQVGANYQFGPAVIGLEGSWDWSNLTLATVRGPSIPLVSLGLPVAANEKIQTSERSFTTASGRLGYAFNTVLVYAKGGAAWMNASYTQLVLNPVTANSVTSLQVISDNRLGFLVGGGVEYGMTENLSATFEYDFMDFGTRDYNFNNLTLPVPVQTPPLTPPGSPVSVPVSVTSYVHLFTVRLNYRFN